MRILKIRKYKHFKFGITGYRGEYGLHIGKYTLYVNVKELKSRLI